MPYVVLPEDSFRIGSCCRRLVGRRIRRKVHLAPEEAVGSSSHRFVEETAVVAAVAAVFDVADTAVAAAFAVGIAVAAETLAVVVGAAEIGVEVVVGYSLPSGDCCSVAISQFRPAFLAQHIADLLHCPLVDLTIGIYPID
jgi:hypothetical protein